MNPIRRPCLAAAAVLLVAGCAAPRIDGQWSDPAFATRSLRDQKVLVSCRGPDSTLARLCEDRYVAAVREAGGQPLVAPMPVDAAGGHEAVARAARAAGATAAIAAAVNVAGVTQSSFGPSLGFGFGGGFGGSSGGIGFGGVGLSVPLGGVRPQTSYGMGSAVLDAATGREMWSVRATSPVADDAPVQIGALARTSVDAMRDAGLFAPR
ncbi:MAG: hypothetical protein EHM87_17780 [Burkholderiales bacterium]|nr:MAG: hypothetical protein EHM87_17780 [Burkholderiales bacterium]